MLHANLQQLSSNQLYCCTSFCTAIRQVASLLSYTAGSAVNQALGFLGFLKESATANPSSQLSSIAHKEQVQNATNALLLMLGQAAGSSDAAELNGLVAAAAKLARASAVSPAAGKALIDLFK
jgi:hypothetical protein